MSDTDRFRMIPTPDGVLHVAPEFEEAARALGALERKGLDTLLAHGSAGTSGRAATRVLELPRRPERLHLRPLCHGGALAFLTGRRFIGLARPLAEIEVSEELLERGARVPRPVLVLGRRTGLLWEAAVGSVHEEDSQDAAAFLATSPSAPRVRAAARAAGAALRLFHDAGGRHADLNAGNLLIREEVASAEGEGGSSEENGGSDKAEGRSSEVVVVDLDRAVLAREVPPSRRMKELMRLYRSLLKRGLLDRVGRRGCAAFLGAYTGGDRSLRRALLAHLPRERLRVALHALRY